MSISKHPDIATLMTCSAGSTPEALCAVVTSHLSMCPECQSELGAMENIGVALFEKSEPVGMSDSALSCSPSPMIADDREGHMSPRGDIPGPLVGVIGHHLDDLNWEVIGQDISTVQVPMVSHKKGDLRLIRLAPALQLPESRHPGEELLLVLRGSCHETQAGNCLVGDCVERHDDVKPALRAGAEGCILLVGNEHVPEFAAVPA